MKKSHNDEKKKKNRKILVGEVVGNKMEKTIVVKVSKREPHPLYKKIQTKVKK